MADQERKRARLRFPWEERTYEVEIVSTTRLYARVKHLNPEPEWTRAPFPVRREWREALDG